MIPLSAAQRRIWLLHSLSESDASQNSTLAIRYQGDLNHVALQTAFQAIVDRHAALRIRVEEVSGDLYQHIEPPARDYDWRVEEVSSEASAVELLLNEARRGFDLRREAPIRGLLCTVNPNDGYLLLTIHHISADAWSLGPLFRDLRSYYSAAVKQEEAILPELVVEYSDYIAWHEELLGDPNSPGSLSYDQLRSWRDALSGLPHQIQIPCSRPNSRENQDARVISHRVDVDADTWRALRDLAIDTSATEFVVFEAVVAAFFALHGSGTDIPLGAVVAGRDDEALLDVVGCFVNTVVLRARVDADARFVDLVRRVREASLFAITNQDVPFDQLVEHLRPRRRVGNSPIVQIMTTFFKESEAGHYDLLDAVGKRVDLPNMFSTFDVTFTVRTEAQNVSCVMDVSAQLFDAQTATLMAAAFGDFLVEALRRPQDLLRSLENPGLKHLAPGTVEVARSDLDENYLQRGNDDERLGILLQIVADVLGGIAVKPDDNFFDVGGYSLLALKIVSRVREQLGLELALRDVFESADFRSLERKLEQAPPRLSKLTARTRMRPGE